MPPEAVDLVSRLLQYSPNLRCTAVSIWDFLSLFVLLCKQALYFSIIMYLMQLDALTHPFFDELRDLNTRLPNGRFLPPLFNFKSHGMILFWHIISFLFENSLLSSIMSKCLPSILLLLLSIRIEGCSCGDFDEIGARACKKASPILGVWLVWNVRNLKLGPRYESYVFSWPAICFYFI